MKDYHITGSIVTHNNMSTIAPTVSSIRKHTVAIPFSLYVIDNASVDGTPDIVREIAPEAKLIRNAKNLGFGKAHNQILPRLQSKYHAFINPDIIISGDVMATMADYLDEHPDVVMLSPRIVFPGTNRNQILGKRNPTLRYLLASRLRKGRIALDLLQEYAMLDHDLTKPQEVENATGCFMFLRTAALKKIGGFDERYFLYFEDCDLTREIRRFGKTLYFPQAVVQHVWNRESKKNAALALVQIESMLKYFQKWRPHRQAPGGKENRRVF
jgi:GT2 family glycosyltransferase